MAHLLGLDPSLQKAGYVVLDSESPDSDVIERGMLKTSPEDGITIQRLIIQAERVRCMLEKYNIGFIGMEAPFFGAGSTEVLFALNQFLHGVFLEKGVYVVCFPPQMLKKLVFPDRSVAEVHKPHMIDRAKTALGLQGKRLAEDVADAYWAGIFGKRFYRWQFQRDLKLEDLGEYERETFCGKHTYTRGPKKGSTDLNGIIYRENELFFDFKAIKRRTESGLQKDKEKAEGED
jgi:Holliday junction resolvasome RuvABC endonuclease subunit